MKLANKLLLAIFLLVLISPIGIILPAIFKAEAAWGEWNLEEIKKMLGYIPLGMEKAAEIWHPILPDYNFPNNFGGNLYLDSIAYIVSGIVGTLACIGLTFLWVKFFKLFKYNNG